MDDQRIDELKNPPNRVPMVLAGRCANGAEGGRGKRVHSVPAGAVAGKALCNAKPGRLSAGWSKPWPEDREVDCPRCLDWLRQIERATMDERSVPHPELDPEGAVVEPPGDDRWPNSE